MITAKEAKEMAQNASLADSYIENILKDVSRLAKEGHFQMRLYEPKHLDAYDSVLNNIILGKLTDLGFKLDRDRDFLFVKWF